MGKGRARRIRVEAGHEYSPTGVGRLVLTIEADGRVELVVHRFGKELLPVYRLEVGADVIGVLDEALVRAGFPDAPSYTTLVPDEAPTTFWVWRGWFRKDCASIVTSGERIPGYRDAVAVFDALCHVASGGEYGYVREDLQPLFHAPREPALPPIDPPKEWAGDDDDDGPPAPHPLVGTDVYLPSEVYVSRGEDDFAGGLCRVVAVRLGTSAGAAAPFIEVREQPGLVPAGAPERLRQGLVRVELARAGHGSGLYSP